MQIPGSNCTKSENPTNRSGSVKNPLTVVRGILAFDTASAVGGLFHRESLFQVTDFDYDVRCAPLNSED